MDMLEVGVTCCPVGGGKERKGFPTLSYVEARWHFAQWAIASSPLILSMDLRDTEATRKVWDIVTNEEILSINQACESHGGC